MKEKIHPQLKALAIPIAKLVEDPENARLHDDANIEAIAQSLTKYGQRSTIVVHKDGRVLKGNGTMRAAISLGWKKIAAITVDDDPTTASGYAIADNRTSDLSTWDYEQLKANIDKILAIDESYEIPGYTADDIKGLNWDSDLEEAKAQVDGIESNLDGIPERIVINVPSKDAPEVRKEINALIRSKGLAWEKVSVA